MGRNALPIITFGGAAFAATVFFAATRAFAGVTNNTNITTNVQASASTGGNSASGGSGMNGSPSQISQSETSEGKDGAPGAVVQGNSSVSIEVRQTVNGIAEPPVIVSTSSPNGSAKAEVNITTTGQGRTVQTNAQTGVADPSASAEASARRGTANSADAPISAGTAPQNARGVAALRGVLGELIAILRNLSLSLVSLFR